jgi:hypothetical protein
MQEFVEAGLAEITQVGYQHPINLYVVNKAMEKYNHQYFVFPSWIIKDAKRFVVETIHGDESGNIRIFEGLSIEQVEQYFWSQDYQVYVTDIAHRKDSDIAKEWRKQQKAKEQEQLKIRKADLDRREADLKAREDKISAGLSELKACIDSLQAGLTHTKSRKVRVTIKEKRPVVALTSNEPTPYLQSMYIKSNGIVDNATIGRLVYEYMKEHKVTMSPKDIETWIRLYCPAVTSKWTSVNKGAYNILEKNLKNTGLVAPVGRGQYTAI